VRKEKKASERRRPRGTPKNESFFLPQTRLRRPEGKEREPFYRPEARKEKEKEKRKTPSRLVIERRPSIRKAESDAYFRQGGSNGSTKKGEELTSHASCVKWEKKKEEGYRSLTHLGEKGGKEDHRLLPSDLLVGEENGLCLLLVRLRRKKKKKRGPFPQEKGERKDHVP